MSTGDPQDAYPMDQAGTLAAAEIASAWERELPGVATGSIRVITPLWRVAKLLADERRRLLQRLGIEPATLDLLSTLRRAGSPYQLTTRQLTERTLVTAGAISQRLARAERAGHVVRSAAGASPRGVTVTLTPAGHQMIDTTVRALLEHEEALLAALDEHQREHLGDLLTRLDASLRSQLGPVAPSE